MAGATLAVAPPAPSMDRLAERFLTLIGVPILMLVIGGVSTVLWSDRDANARRDVTLTTISESLKALEIRTRERVESSETRTRQDVEALRVLIAEATRRGEMARSDLSRVMTERDAELAKQIADQAGAAGQFRVQVGVLTEQVAAMRSDLQEIKSLLTRPPQPARAIDRLPNGWTGSTR